MTKIVVIGGSGFIGTNYMLDALAKGLEVHNLDLAPPPTVYLRNYWTKCDIMQTGELRSLLESLSPHQVLVLAARTDTLSDDVKDYTVNSEGTLSILKALSGFPVDCRVIFTSTQFVLGPEAAFVNFEQYAPHTAYGQSKVEAEKYIKMSNPSYIWTIIRPTNIWGPWHPRYPKEFWKVLKRGLYFHPSGHDAIRSYGYVGNIIDQINMIFTKEAGLVRGKTFYVGDRPIPLSKWVDGFSRAMTGRRARRIPQSLLQLMARMGDVIGTVRPNFPISSSRFASMTTDYPTPMERTFEVLGDPRISLEQGIEETVKWMKDEKLL